MSPGANQGVSPDSEELIFLTLADESFVAPVAVLGRSLIDHLDPRRTAVLRVIDGGLSASSKTRLLELWSRSGEGPRVRADFVAPEFGRLRELPVWGRFSALTYARIWAPAYVGKGCRKVIVLDADMLVLSDLSRLWDLPLGEAHLLAAQDQAIPWLASPGGVECWRELGLDPQAKFFNAGLMVINVGKWREDRIPEHVIRFIEDHRDRLNHCDQDALNAVLAGRWRELDLRWQVQPRMAELERRQGLRAAANTGPGEAWVLHFSGRLKPWVYPGLTSYDQLFLDYLDRTCWRDWRHGPTLRGWLLRLYESRFRARLYPLEKRAHALHRAVTRRSAGPDR